MNEIFWAIALTFVFDLLMGIIITQRKKIKRAKEIREFDIMLNKILSARISDKEKISRALDLCRNTVGDEGFGAYLVLNYMENNLKSK